MNDLQPLSGLLLAGEALIASSLLLGLAWLLARAHPRRAAARRLVWIVAFAGLLALPLLTLAAPGLAVIALPAASQPGAPPPVLAEAQAGPSWSLWADLIPLAFAAWVAGVVTIGVQHLVALARLELMRRAAAAWPLPPPLPVGRCQVLVSEACPGPMTWGVLRPVIMLPDEALDWTSERIKAVLQHELAHVRRRDGLVQALTLLACALYWPNPLVWAAARTLRREVERAADDAVIAAGTLPSDYAGHLLALASEWRERRLTTTGLAMAAPPAFSVRLQSILSTEPDRTGATAMDALRLILIGSAATSALVLARPSLAQAPAAPALPAPPAISERPLAAPPAPASQPALAAAPRASATPAPAAKPARPRGHARGVIDGKVVADDGRPLTPQEQAELNRKLAEIGPTIRQALADAHIDQLVQSRVAAANAQAQAEIARQMAELGPRIQQAIAAAHIDERVQQQLAAIQPRIDAALDRAQRDIERAQRERERRLDREGDAEAPSGPAPQN